MVEPNTRVRESTGTVSDIDSDTYKVSVYDTVTEKDSVKASDKFNLIDDTTIKSQQSPFTGVLGSLAITLLGLELFRKQFDKPMFDPTKSDAENLLNLLEEIKI